MNARRGALAVALLSLIALAAVRLVGSGPPLYDGYCAPLHYLLLGGHPRPSSASATYTADEVTQTQELATTEAAPQAQVVIPADGLAVPAGATVTVTITPVPTPATRPADGTIVGNVYRFSAQASTGQALTLAVGHPATIVLEVPSAGAPQLTLERLDTTAWTRLQTVQGGCGDTALAASPSLGLFALVGQGAAASPAVGSQGEGGVTIIVTAAALVVLAVILGAVQLARRRR